MQTRKPMWWLLYTVILILIGLLALDHDLVLSLLGHELVQAGILVFVFVLIGLWVRGNESRLARDARPIEMVARITVCDPAQSERDLLTADARQDMGNGRRETSRPRRLVRS